MMAGMAPYSLVALFHGCVVVWLHGWVVVYCMTVWLRGCVSALVLVSELPILMEVSSVSPRVPPPPRQLRSGMIFLCEIPYPRGQIIV